VKKLILALTIIALIALLMMPMSAAADDGGYTKINKRFTVSPSGNGHQIPQGSIVYHQNDGTTRVFGPNKSLLLKAKNSEAAAVPTPTGPRKATHVIEVPDGSLIKEVDEKKTEVYYNHRLILTTINEEAKLPVPQIRQSGGWVECGQTLYNTSYPADFSEALWQVPSAPPDPHSDTINFIFNGIENYSARNLLLQPVLEWNYPDWGSQPWTITAWYMSGANQYHSDSHPTVYGGDEIYGAIGYQYGTYDWLVGIYNMSDFSSSLYLRSYTSIDPGSISAVWTLEAYRWINYQMSTINMTDDDICGDITFYDIYLSRNGNRTNFTPDNGWVNTAVWDGKLTGLSKDWHGGNTTVTLNTAN
jgi:hypothetical protein